MLEHSQLLTLLSGKNDPLWICSVPERARMLFACSTGAVYLSRTSALHILSSHADFDSFDILQLPIAIVRGSLFTEPDKPRALNAIYRSPNSRIYFVSMKVASEGHELWVSSMYRLTERKMQKKLRKSFAV